MLIMAKLSKEIIEVCSLNNPLINERIDSRDQYDEYELT